MPDYVQHCYIKEAIVLPVKRLVIFGWFSPCFACLIFLVLHFVFSGRRRLLCSWHQGKTLDRFSVFITAAYVVLQSIECHQVTNDCCLKKVISRLTQCQVLAIKSTAQLAGACYLESEAQISLTVLVVINEGIMINIDMVNSWYEDLGFSQI